MAMSQNGSGEVKVQKEPKVVFSADSLVIDKEYPSHKAEITFHGNDGEVLNVEFYLEIEEEDNSEKNVILNSNINEKDAFGDVKSIRGYTEKINGSMMTAAEFAECSRLYGSNRKDIAERKKLYSEEIREGIAGQDMLYRALKRVSYDKDDNVDVFFEIAKRLVMEKFPEHLKQQIAQQNEAKKRQMSQKANAELREEMNKKRIYNEYASSTDKNDRKEREEYLKTHHIARIRHKLAQGIDNTFGTNLDAKKPADVAKDVLGKAAIVSLLVGGPIGAVQYLEHRSAQKAQKEIALKQQQEAQKEAQLRKEIEQDRIRAEQENKIMLQKMEEAGIKTEKKDKKGNLLTLSAVKAEKVEVLSEDGSKSVEYKFSDPKWTPKEQTEQEGTRVLRFVADEVHQDFIGKDLHIVTTYDTRFEKQKEMPRTGNHATDWTLISKAEQQR